MNQTPQGYAGTICALSMIAIWLPALLNGPLSLMLGGFTLLFAVLFIVGSVRRRRSTVYAPAEHYALKVRREATLVRLKP